MAVFAALLLLPSLVAAASFPSPGSSGVASEPWPALNGGGFTGQPAPTSPDPLVRYVWPLPGVNDSVLQIYELPAVAVEGAPAASFSNTSSAVGSIACGIRVAGAGNLTIDFGVELPAWLEFDSPDLTAAAASSSVMLGLGEYNAVGFYAGYKQAAPKVYGSGCGAAMCTFRLETNSELYEGLRFGFVAITTSPSFAPFTITALRAVVQAKPVNYRGSFSAPGDPLLERTWWTGAYTVRATLQSDYMGSILIDRGDRIGWTGDLHTTQAASMAAFSNFDFVLANLNRTQCANCCNGIATYCLYFVLSAVDYWRATGDAAALASFAAPIAAKLDTAAKLYADPVALRFVGHDDRLGDGFCDPVTNETRAVYRFLAIRAWREYASASAAIGNAAAAEKYANLSTNAIAALRAGVDQPWWKDLGVHAAAEALAGGWATPSEAASIADAKLSDIVTIPSQSNFQQYFILLALSSAGLLDRGVESARVVWGAELQLGATTFWEQSHPDWRSIVEPAPGPVPNEAGWSSLAHPWSAGVTAWLSAWVTGVRPIEPGYSRVLVAPHVAHGMRGGVSGRVPTPHGPVSVSVKRAPATGDRGNGGDDGAVLVDVALPDGVTGTLVLSEPTLRRVGRAFCAGTDIASLTVVNVSSGVTVAARVEAHPAAPRADERAGGGAARARALVIELGGGVAHSLRVQHRGDSCAAVDTNIDASPFPPPTWPGALIKVDETTLGDWRGVYGSAGIFFLGQPRNTSTLPPWVVSATVLTPQNSGFNGEEFAWPSAQTAGDARALESQNGGGPRALGAAAPSGSGSFPIDFVLGAGAPARFRVAVYYCDFGPTPWGDGQRGDSRTQEAYLLRIPSLDPLTPRVALRGFAGGVWHVYEIGESFRLRTTTLRGDYATVSAVAFDV